MKIDKIIDKDYKKPVLDKSLITFFVWVIYCFFGVIFSRGLGVSVSGYILLAIIFVGLALMTVWLASKLINRGYRRGGRKQ